MEINVKRFVQLLLEENRKQNLVSRKAGPEELEQHVLDSLQILEWVSLTGLEVVDIGSGAGFPGLILAMACRESRLTLVESDLKKSAFLQEVSKKLGLENVHIVRDRIETVGHDNVHRGKYDLCTSRAVAAMRILLEYGLPLVKPGGTLLMWKGSNYKQEIVEAGKALDILGGEVVDVYQYNLIHERDRAIVAVKKVRATPDQYPRRIGAPTKKPL